MKRALLFFFSVLTVLSVLVAGCSSTNSQATPTTDANTQFTAVAATVNAALTQSAELDATPTTAEEPTSTPETVTDENNTDNDTAGNEGNDSNGDVTPTAEPVDVVTDATATALPVTILPTTASTAVAVPDQAEFVSDITVADDSEMEPDEEFTKTWRVKNVGSTTWTTDYVIRFYSGNSMGAASSTSLSKTVAPGESVDISIPMQAPSDEGDYLAYFVITNADGYNFYSMYVSIVVTNSSDSDD